ncbi:MAG: hypothetical protein L0H29_09975, partial [Sinobacteraceae bacterium]|nr:hypothetical protein [Nevskiaceae bacterium]
MSVFFVHKRRKGAGVKFVIPANAERTVFKPLSMWWRFAPNRIVTGFALRGVIALMVPFLVLLVFGDSAGAVFAALGGLHALLA